MKCSLRSVVAATWAFDIGYSWFEVAGGGPQALSSDLLTALLATGALDAFLLYMMVSCVAGWGNGAV